MSDKEISKFINEEKIMPEGIEDLTISSIGLKKDERYRRGEISLKGVTTKKTYYIKIRQTIKNENNFSIILTLEEKGEKLFRLIRFNGPDSSPHINHIEQTEIEDAHIHFATQRYQEKGFNEDHFAKGTTRYSDLSSALKIFKKEVNIIPRKVLKFKRLNVHRR